ncbi:transmembrane histidine kinase [Ligilactobacillus acidipiscis DSM 15836]|uniref:Signal transduction histidine-protein kinase ArlS n=1 Tax=Ligilactobacillus acidipiscis DSM 15836 TaxID=1423716 RepID=A0ABR5PLJ1_9LACO|nr:HAMP domain-containing histidine kinase [Ligilactobacillus acidipiscis]KRM30702.1 transmembrane histidine kinase [Ligilactobacillus acidipiscis DSM 15836]GAW63229.1 two-component system sensor histidine kinase [Ligilactobacillus acidipiscis]GEN20544.1 two-component sensor histidine kinase [Ligilactobacillus acidipiscis]
MDEQIVTGKDGEQGVKNDKRFVSLKVKWSVGMGLGVLIIFAIFAVLLFQSFSSILLRQEKTYSYNALSTASERLENQDSELDAKHVKQVLSYDVAPTEEKGQNTPAPYTDAAFTSLARKNLAVSVYDLSGDLIFASRNVPYHFKKAGSNKDAVIRDGSHHIFVTSRAVRSNSTNQVIGYAQVTNTLKDYDQARSKFILIFIVFGITAGLAIALLSLGLSSWLLKPIESLNEAMRKLSTGNEGRAIATVRVPQLKQRDELSELSELFNDMLDQMQGYIEQQLQFVEDVSHELRTPVAVIKGHMDLLNRWGKDDPEVLTESIDASLQEITRMESLVQEMLDLSRAGQVNVQFGNETSDIREVALQVFSNFEMIHPDFHFSLDNELKEKTEVKMYRNHLEQIMVILMDNAVKYSQERKEIYVTLSKTNCFAELVVQDFGAGIPDEEVKKIFGRFYRVDKARSRDQGGNGLGLSIAQRLLEGYRGKITVESAEGQGSLFKVSIPLYVHKTNKQEQNKNLD